MSGVSTIDMVVVGTFLVISVCVVGCMLLLNCFYHKQRHGHQPTILAHTLGSRKSCGYNRSSNHTLILIHTHKHSVNKVQMNAMKVFFLSFVLFWFAIFVQFSDCAISVLSGVSKMHIRFLCRCSIDCNYGDHNNITISCLECRRSYHKTTATGLSRRTDIIVVGTNCTSIMPAARTS